MKKILVLLTLLFFINFFGQDVNGGFELNKYTPPIIESKPFVFTNYSSFGSVDKLTGSFGVNIPFHEIKTPFLNIPIILSYTTNGVKMNQISNEIGIDWNLVSGGSITRKINEFPDDIFEGNFDYPKLTMDIQQNDLLPLEYQQPNLYPIDRPMFFYQGYKGSATSNGGTHYQIHFPRRLDHTNIDSPETPMNSEIVCLVEKKALQETTVGSIPYQFDTQPDIFTVNIGLESFRFIIKRKAQYYNVNQTGFANYGAMIHDRIEIVPLDDLGYKIEFNSIPWPNTENRIYKKYKNQPRKNGIEFFHNFIITDKNGVRYSFEKYEFSDYDVLKQHFNAYDSDINISGKIYIDYKEYMTDINKWYLTKIDLPNGEIITYNYIPNEYLFQKDINRTHDGEYTNYPYNLNPIKTPYGIDWLDVHNEGFSLAEINYNNQKVKFHYDTYRPDYKSGGLSLKKIELLYANQLIKKIDLIKEFNFFDDEGHIYYRMFLKEIKDSTVKDSYVFEYNYPEMNRRDHVRYQDLFGYYLGNSNNTYPSFPTIYVSPNNQNGNKISYETPVNSDYFIINGTNRTPNPLFTKSGTLKKVHFPTGGYLEVDYENNTYYDNRLLSKKSLGPGVRVKSLNYFKNENLKVKKINYHYDLFDDNTYSSGRLLYKPSYAFISNWALNNSYNRANLENTPLLDRFQVSNQIRYFEMQYFDNFITYEMLNGSSLSLENKYKKLIRFSSYPMGATHDIYGKELIYTNVKEEYVDLNNNNKGYTKSYFKYSDNRTIVKSVGGPSDEPSEFQKGSPNLRLFVDYLPFFGCGVTCNYEYFKTRSGLIEKSGYDIYPFPERNYFANKDNASFGKLEKIEYYNNNNELITSDEYEYDYIMKESPNTNVLKNIKTGYLKLHQYKNNDPTETFTKQYIVPPFNFYIANRHNFTGHYYFSIDSLRFNSKVVIKTKKTNHYFNSNNSVLNEEINFQYDNNSGNLIKQSTINSNLDLVEKVYAYPYLDSGDIMLDSLASQNIISKPYYIKTMVNNLLTEDSEFKYFIHSTGMVLPNKLKKFKSGSNNTGIGEDVFLFARYNEKGLLQEYSEPTGINTVIIYGYNESEIIAKIENATYAQVAPFVANLQNISNTSTEANLITALNSLRTSLPNAMITTYTYKPLIGLSTVTDPTGEKQTYHYDNFNRLEFVKDNQGNILSENQYHYRTQN